MPAALAAAARRFSVRVWGFNGSNRVHMQDAYTARTSAQLLLEALVSSGGSCEAALQAAVHDAFERAAAAKVQSWRVSAPRQ